MNSQHGTLLFVTDPDLKKCTRPHAFHPLVTVAATLCCGDHFTNSGMEFVFMPRKVDLTGQKFGRLSVVGFSGLKREGKKQHTRRMWHCQCDCGCFIDVQGNNLKTGHTQSCGCLGKDSARARAVHGEGNNGSETKEYRAWIRMKDRVNNSNSIRWADWGGRGIKICPEWENSYSAFLNDMGRAPAGYTLDRIDSNGNYEKGNCRWATYSEQNNNKRNNVFLTHLGKTQTMKLWSRELGLKYETIRRRRRQGMTTELILAVGP